MAETMAIRTNLIRVVLHLDMLPMESFKSLSQEFRSPFRSQFGRLAAFRPDSIVYHSALKIIKETCSSRDDTIYSGFKKNMFLILENLWHNLEQRFIDSPLKQKAVVKIE